MKKLDRRRNKELTYLSKKGAPKLNIAPSVFKGRMYSIKATSEKDLLDQVSREIQLNQMLRFNKIRPDKNFC